MQTRSVQAELAGEGSSGQAADGAAHPTAAHPQQVAGDGSSTLGADAGAAAGTPSAAEPQQQQPLVPGHPVGTPHPHAEAARPTQHGLEVCRAALPSDAAGGHCAAAGHPDAEHGGPPAAAELRTLVPGSKAGSGTQRQAAAELRTLVPGSGGGLGMQRPAAGPAQVPQEALQAERGPTDEAVPVVGPAAQRVAQLSQSACPEGNLHGTCQQAGAGSLGHLPAGPAQQCTAAVLAERDQPLPGSRLGTQAGSGVLAKAALPLPAHPGSRGNSQLGSGVLAEAGRGGFADPGSSRIGNGRLAQVPLPGSAHPGSRSAGQPATGVLAQADQPGPVPPGSGGSSQLGSGILSGPPDADDMSDEMAAQMEQAELAFQAKLRLPADGGGGSSTEAPGDAGARAGSQTQPYMGGAALGGMDSHAQPAGPGPEEVLQASTERDSGAAQRASSRRSPALSGAQAAAATAGASSLQQKAVLAAAQQQQQQQQVQAGGPVAGILDDGFGASAFGDEEAFEAELAQLLAAADAPRGAKNPAAAGPPGPSGHHHHHQASQRASQQLRASQMLHGPVQTSAAGCAGPASQVCTGSQEVGDCAALTSEPDGARIGALWQQCSCMGLLKLVLLPLCHSTWLPCWQAEPLLGDLESWCTTLCREPRHMSAMHHLPTHFAAQAYSLGRVVQGFAPDGAISTGTGGHQTSGRCHACRQNPCWGIGTWCTTRCWRSVTAHLRGCCCCATHVAASC